MKHSVWSSLLSYLVWSRWTRAVRVSRASFQTECFSNVAHTQTVVNEVFM
ncbi:unnamed protein product [Ixodes persulcatus]